MHQKIFFLFLFLLISPSVIISQLTISVYHVVEIIISTRSTFTKMANYPGTKLVGVAFKLQRLPITRDYRLQKTPIKLRFGGRQS